MEDLILLIETNKKWIIATILTLIGLFIGYKRLKIMSRKDAIDNSDFESKKINFSLYIHQGYRLFDKNKESLKYLLFNIDILNKSASKITVTPSVILKIKKQENKVILQHNKYFFLEDYHKNIDKLENNISLEERGKKTGWIIFEIPKELVDKRIELIQILCQDTLSNECKADFYLLKDLYYETKEG